MNFLSQNRTLGHPSSAGQLYLTKLIDHHTIIPIQRSFELIQEPKNKLFSILTTFCCSNQYGKRLELITIYAYKDSCHLNIK